MRKVSVRVLGALAVLSGALVGALLLPGTAFAAAGDVIMSRLYNPNSGEHFYTANEEETRHLVSVGWRYEGIGWFAPASSDTPVYRLYNPNAGDHHYTTSVAERDHLRSVGWRYEGIGWYSDDARTVALLRQYNPNARAGAHNFTTSEFERDSLVKAGWSDEDIGWYALEAGVSAPAASGGSTSHNHKWDSSKVVGIYEDRPTIQINWDRVHEIEEEYNTQYNPETAYWFMNTFEGVATEGPAEPTWVGNDYYRVCTGCGRMEPYYMIRY